MLINSPSKEIKVKLSLSSQINLKLKKVQKPLG